MTSGNKSNALAQDGRTKTGPQEDPDDFIDDPFGPSLNATPYERAQSVEQIIQEQKADISNKDVGGINTNIEFYRRIKERILVNDDDLSRKHFEFYKSWITKMRYGVIVLYAVVIPFMEVPNWCLDKYAAEPGITNQDLRFTFSIPCSKYDLPQSNLLMLGLFYSNILDIMCVIYFGYSRLHRIKWCHQRPIDKRITVVMGILFATSLIDQVLSIVLIRRAFFAGLLRPFLVACFLNSVRQSMLQLVFLLKDSFIYLVCIFLYVFTFSALAYFIYRQQYEGYSYF